MEEAHRPIPFQISKHPNTKTPKHQPPLTPPSSSAICRAQSIRRPDGALRGITGNPVRLRNGPAAVIPTPDGDPLGRESATGPLKRPGKAAGAGGKSEDLPSGATLPGRWQILKLRLGDFVLCARQGALTWRWKPSTRPTGGSVSRTARVPTVRWDLKEAAGKALARRTETAYEASTPDEKANIFKVLNLSGGRGRICGGHKREGGCAIPGEICGPATCYRCREAPGGVCRSQPRA